jgi:hypothetical protein
MHHRKHPGLKMHLSYLLAFHILAIPMVFAEFINHAADMANQQQIPLGPPQAEQLTLTQTLTRTRFDFEYHTVTMTGTAPAASTDETHQEATGRRISCDETACAVCRWSSGKCEAGTLAW